MSLASAKIVTANTLPTTGATSSNVKSILLKVQPKLNLALTSGPPGPQGPPGTIGQVAQAGVVLPSESTVNFKGGLLAVDNSGSSRTDVDVQPSVVNIGSTPSESGATGDVIAVKSDGTAHRYSPMGISAATYGMVGDGVQRTFSSVSGATVTFPVYTPTSADVGKLVCIPGAGSDDGTGVKDGFTTTVSAINAGLKQWTLTNSVTTNVSSGSNLLLAVGTNNDTAYANYVNSGVAGARGYIPPGNYCFTTAPNMATPITSPAPTPPRNSGMWIEGAGAGTNAATNAQSATNFWFMGPTNVSQGAGVNGAGAPAMWAASTNSVYNIKLRGFGILCLRNVSIGTTVSGAGQVINASSSLTVASTTGWPSFGRVFITGVGECQYTGLSGGNTITGLQPDVPGSTATNGGSVFLQMAAFYQDNVQQSHTEDVVIVGYQDNNGSSSSALGGIAYWHNAPSVGNSIVDRVYSRFFAGPNAEGFRISAVNTGYGVQGNCGDMVLNSTVATAIGKYGYHIYVTGSGPLDTIVLNAPKTGVQAGGVSYYLHGTGVVGTVINGPHSECGQGGAHTAFLFAGAQGCKVNGGYGSCNGGVVGDGSVFVSFTGTANHNIFQGEWTGATSPSSSAAYDYVCAFASTTYGNRVETSSTPTTRPYPGTAHLQPQTAATPSNYFRDFSTNMAASYAGTAQNWVPTYGMDAGTGQQPGVIAPDSRGPRGISPVTLVSNQAFFSRFVVSRSLYVTKITFVVTTAAGVTSDAVDVGIYQSLTPGSGNLTKIVTSGSTTPTLTTGLKTVNVGPVTLVPGAVYYAAIAYGTPGGTAAAVQGVSFGNFAAGFFGVTAGLNDAGIMSTAFPLPSTTSSITWSQVSTPIMAVREA